ncbi:MAG: hypothetical protein AAB634_03000, partial [Patescibacteria group bacterium]
SDFLGPMSATTHFKVNVSISGGGTGSVLSNPSGSSCGTGCTEYPKGTTATLTASPSGGSKFDGWSGKCSGTGACVPTGNSSVTATFSVAGFPLSVHLKGTGQGTTSANVGSFSCEKNAAASEPLCSYQYAPGTEVTLTGIAWVGSTFVGWSGPCAGIGNCTVTVNGVTNVTATFNAEGPQALLPSLRDTLVASVFNLSGFVRRAASPLFTGDATRTIRGSTSLGRSNLSGRRLHLSSRHGGVADIFDAVRPLILRGREALSSLFAPTISGAQGAVDYQNYFKPAKVGLKEAALKDEALEPDTVYIYRVKSCAEANGVVDCTAWSIESAGKTMRNVEKTEPGAGDRRAVCTKNSFCNFGAEFAKKVSSQVPFGIPEVEESEQQCRVNADCANVGRFEQSFEER